MRYVLIILSLSALHLYSSAISEEKKDGLVDINFKDGRVLEGCRILTSSPTDVMVLHGGGKVENIKIELLAEDMQKELGFSQQAALAHAEKISAANKKAQSKREALEIKREAREIVARTISKGMAASLEIMQVTNEGMLAKGYAYVGPAKRVTRTYSRTVNAGSKLNPGLKKKVKSTKVVFEREKVEFSEWIFVEMEPSGYVDGDMAEIIMFPAGTYSYTSILGSLKTVNKYTTDFTSLLSPDEVKALAVLTSDEITQVLKSNFMK